MAVKKSDPAGYILIVEDDRSTACIEAHLLKPLGLKIRKACTAKEAVKILKKSLPEFMLLDFSLPDMTALEMLEKLKADKIPIPPFIVVTGKGGEKAAVDLMKAGAHDYLIKGLDMLAVLPDRVKNVLTIVGLRRELERAKRLAEEEREKFKLIFEAAYDGMLVAEAGTGKFLAANAAMCRMLGYSAEEITNLCIKDIHPAESLPFVLNFFSGTTPIKEIALKRKDGSVFYAELSGQKIQFPGQTAMLGIFRDLTERDREAGLLRDIIDKNPMSIQILDKEGFALKVNPAYIRIFGTVPPADFSIFADLQSIFPKSRDMILRAKAGEIVSFPDTYFNPHDARPGMSDSPVCIHATLFPLKDRFGKPERFVCMYENITRRKKAEEELKEAKALADSVLENVPSMIFLKEAKDLNFVLLNRAGEELLGYDRKTLIGKNDFDFFSAEQAAFFTSKDRGVLEGKKKLLDILEEPISTAKKGIRLLHTLKVCIRGDDGKAKYLLGISEDITERKKMEEELRQIYKRVLKVREDEKRGFSAALHDAIGSMVVGCSASLLVAQKELPRGNTAATAASLEHVSSILKETAANLKRICVDIRPPALETSGLTGALADLVSRSKGYLPIKVSYSGNLPADWRKTNSPIDIAIYRLAQEALNNASKYSMAKTMNLAVSYTSDKIRFVAIDDGCGFDTSSKTTGLGLKIMQEEIKLAGGKLLISSRKGHGTVIKAEFPRKSCNEED